MVKQNLSKLTDYCREEFAKFKIFYFKKVPKLDSFQVKFVNLSSEKVVSVVCYNRNSSAVIG